MVRKLDAWRGRCSPLVARDLVALARASPARAEYLDVLAWYDNQEAGLGDRLADDIDGGVDFLRAWPDAAPPYPGRRRLPPIRRKSTEVFPSSKISDPVTPESSQERIEWSRVWWAMAHSSRPAVIRSRSDAFCGKSDRARLFVSRVDENPFIKIRIIEILHPEMQQLSDVAGIIGIDIDVTRHEWHA